jgi:CDGSH-type Zn-finger protein
MAVAPTPLSPAPHFIDVIEGETYAWCACGRSRNQPFCDGSHKGGDVKPLSYTAGTSCEVVFCGCKTSDRAPICGGSACAG